MTHAYLVYPHQLFEALEMQKEIRTVVFMEDPLFFKQYLFHKQKLVFHRAAMRSYAHRLETKGFKVLYVESASIDQTEQIAAILTKHSIEQVHVFDLVDDWLEKKLEKGCAQQSIKIVRHPSPGFFLSAKDVDLEFGDQRKFSMSTFYVKQRKKFHLLLEEGKPLGGKWSFDTENRKKLPKNLSLPPSPTNSTDPFVLEAKRSVEKEFKENYGSLDNFFYPIHHAEAKKWLHHFFSEKFSSFGPYQDSIAAEDSFLFHSLLSPLINAGLITPSEVVYKAIDYAEKNDISLNSLEGFIRQVVGWREFVRGVYCSIGGEERTKNFWGHHRSLPPSFWKGTTGILPVDNVIKKVLKTGYAHHIERLMVMSNFMLLCEFQPDAIYRWFMELFIDAYDWVMVPNVYGMGLYADGGMVTTKPYISGSNYLLKMSDYKPGNWCEIWNSLYWNFIDKNLAVFEKNGRCQPVVMVLKKMEREVREGHRNRAENFIRELSGALF